MASLTEDMILKKSRAKKLEHVKTLNCWGCKLEDITILQNTPVLEVIGLSGNCIGSLQDFKFCKCLRELYMRRNSVSDLEEVLHLKELKKLQILWMSENPIAAEPGYRKYVIKVLPQLQRLDNEDITEEERDSVRDLSLEDVLAQSKESRSDTSVQKGTGNIRQAVLCLLEELDHDGLLQVKNRIAELLATEELCITA
jgi:Leucine-rich repeat (LRR) protein